MSEQILNEVEGLRLEERLAQVAERIDPEFHYQLTHIRTLVRALMKHGSALDTSDTGTGKTFTAAGAAYVLGLDLFVICPISVRADWKYAAELIGVRLVEATNYEMIRTGNLPYVSTEDKKQYEWHHEILDPVPTLFVLDEVHRCKDYKTQNANLAVAAIEQGYSTLLLSATAADNPMHMKVVALATGLIRRANDFFGWMLANGVTKEPVYGYSRYGKARGPKVLKFTGGDRVLTKLHNQLFPEHGGRMRIKDLGDRFPTTQIMAVAYDMPEASAEIQKAYLEMRAEIAKLRARAAKDRGANILTAKLRARQQVELLKVPAFVEIAEQSVQDGFAVIVYCNFEATLVALSARLGVADVIHGGTKQERRHEIRTQFNDDKISLVLCNIKAGGVAIGLQGKEGGKARLSLINPTYSGIDLKQAFGRPHRAGGCPSIQKIIFAADTVEEEACRKVRAKLHRLAVFNEGEDWSEVDQALDIE
jgi:Mimiviridae putative ATP-dependent RNA helicase